MTNQNHSNGLASIGHSSLGANAQNATFQPPKGLLDQVLSLRASLDEIEKIARGIHQHVVPPSPLASMTGSLQSGDANPPAMSLHGVVLDLSRHADTIRNLLTAAIQGIDR